MFRLFDSNYQAMNPILEEGGNILWLGDCTAAFDRATLDLKGIRTVLTVATGLNVSYPEGGITHKKVYNILDIETANIARFFSDTYTQICEALKRGSVLVHCAAGVSRSASIVVAYVMRSKGMSFQDALNFVRKKRSVIFPNYGFQRQLRNFEKELKEQKRNPDLAQSTDQFSKMEPKKPKEIQMEVQVKQLKPQENLLLTSPAKTPSKEHRQITHFTRSEQKKVATANSTRSNSTQPKFLMSSVYNSTYLGPQIVTHGKNKMYDKYEKKGFNMPGINLKQQYQGYKKM